ncbi:MAG: hypothetical protein ACW99Q_26420 [Candidatus Kariarchaeaceae archaeon]|jgi:hypothetical protein
MSIAMGLLIVILTPLLLLQIVFSLKEPYLFGVYFVLDLFFIFLFINFRMMEIVIYPKNITVSFGIIKKTILLSEVLTCEPISASLGVYTGAGIRVGGDGALAFITKIGGDAVKLGLTSSRPFFSTNKQTEIINVILSLLSPARNE